MLKLNQLPIIENLDKVRIYKNGRKIHEAHISRYKSVEEQIRQNAPDGIMNLSIKNICIVTEGELSLRIVFEIYLNSF